MLPRIVISLNANVLNSITSQFETARHQCLYSPQRRRANRRGPELIRRENKLNQRPKTTLRLSPAELISNNV